MTSLYPEKWQWDVMKGENPIPWQMITNIIQSYVINNHIPWQMTTLYNGICQHYTLTDENTISWLMTTNTKLWQIYSGRWPTYRVKDDNQPTLYPDKGKSYPLTDDNPILWQMTNLYPDKWKPTLCHDSWQLYKRWQSSLYSDRWQPNLYNNRR